MPDKEIFTAEMCCPCVEVRECSRGVLKYLVCDASHHGVYQLERGSARNKPLHVIHGSRFHFIRATLCSSPLLILFDLLTTNANSQKRRRDAIATLFNVLPHNHIVLSPVSASPAASSERTSSQEPLAQWDPCSFAGVIPILTGAHVLRRQLHVQYSRQDGGPDIPAVAVNPTGAHQISHLPARPEDNDSLA